MEKSSFRLLSPELRNVVYEQLLTSDEPLQLDGTSSLKSITETCRELRDESRKFFWANNSFQHTSRKPGARAQHAASSVSVFLSHYLGSEILNVAGRIIFHHLPGHSAAKHADMVINSGIQGADRNLQGNIDTWQRNMGGFGKLGPPSEYLRQILRAYDHLGFELYALRQNRHFNWENATKETDQEMAERLAVCETHEGKHYEFCVVLPHEDDESDSGLSASEELYQEDAHLAKHNQSGNAQDLENVEHEYLKLDSQGVVSQRGKSQENDGEASDVSNWELVASAEHESVTSTVLTSANIEEVNNTTASKANPSRNIIDYTEILSPGSRDGKDDSETESEAENEESEESDHEL